MIWRTGVTQRGSLCDEEVRGGQRRFAFTLLEELERDFDSARDEATLARIYNQLVVGERVYKTTRRGRFGDLDARLVDEVRERLASTSPVLIHDVGASSGVTSLELQLAFEGKHPVQVHATDLYDHLVAVTPKGSKWTIVFDADGQPLQYVSKSFVLSAIPGDGESKRLPINRSLAGKVTRSFLPQAKIIRDAANFRDGQRSFSHELGEARHIRLVHPEVSRMLDSLDGFSFGRHDLFQTTEQRYHVIRAVNVLNPGYFNDDRLREALGALGQSMHAGALLLVGRTIDEADRRNRATLFLRGEDRFEPLWDHEDGAENRDVILSARIPSLNQASSS